MSQSVHDWLIALEKRHREALSSREFLKAVRALSARYVERRAELPRRSPLDSAGKRAAFAAFYAPLHFLTTREVVRAIGAGGRGLEALIDLGCGTGAASTAWALECPRHPTIVGLDKDAWALAEAVRTWRHFGLDGETVRNDLGGRFTDFVKRPPRSFRALGVVAAWTINELDTRARDRLLDQLMTLSRSGAAVLIIEPLSHRAVPWWTEWAEAFTGVGGRRDEWRFDLTWPAPLAMIDEAAGFKREGLTARSLYAGQ